MADEEKVETTSEKILKFMLFFNNIKDSIFLCRKYKTGDSKSAVPDALSNLIMHSLAEFCTTGINRCSMSNIDLANILGCTTDKLSTKMNLFEVYGLGRFVSTGKSSREIVISKDKDEIISKNIYPKAHYTFYLGENLLSILQDKGVLINDLDYDSLRNQIPVSQQILDTISGKGNTEIYVRQILGENVFLEEIIVIERDYNENIGTFKKIVNLCTDNGSGEEQSHEVKNESNTFTPKKNVVEQTSNVEVYETSDTSKVEVCDKADASSVEVSEDEVRPCSFATSRMLNRTQGKNRPARKDTMFNNSKRINQFNRGPRNVEDDYEGEEGELI